MHSPVTRRDLFRSGRDVASLLAVSTFLRELGIPPVMVSAAAEPVLRAGPDVYQSIGVRPLINARGTFTIISGSLMLPEVRAAMDAAAQTLRAPRRADGGRRRASGRAHRRRVGPRHLRLRRGAHARHRRLRRRRQSGPPHPHPESGRLCQGRSDHPDALAATSTTRRSARAACACSKSRRSRSSKRRFGPRTAMVYILAGPRADESALSLRPSRRSLGRRGVPDPGRRGGGDPDHPERAPAERRDARRLQRRQVPARSAERGSAARPQGPGARGVGP